MSVDTQQSFLKGINRRFSRENSVDPQYFWATQNARILQRGNSGTVKRIKGYSKFNTGATDYTKLLDLIFFKEWFIAFYENVGVADQFHVQVVDTNGDEVDNFNYSAAATDEGKLTISGDEIYISPHNKVLYYNDGAWNLTDFISKVPKITGITEVDNSQKAIKKITVSSGASQRPGTKARMSIKVVKVNVSKGDTDIIKLEVDGNQTADIELNYGDTPQDVRDKLYDAAVATGTITTDWTVSKKIDRLDSGYWLYFTADSEGSAWNDKRIKIISTTDGNDSIVYEDIDERRPIDNFIDEDRNDLGPLDIRLNPSRDIWNATFVTTTSRGGSDPETDLGPMQLLFSRANSMAITENILTTDTYAEIGVKIKEAIEEENSIKEEYVVTVNDTGTAYEILITALVAGKKYNTTIEPYFMHNDNKVPAADRLTITVATQQPGLSSDATGTLENNEDYWYKVRARYKDGHLTATSLPVYVNTGNAESLTISIETDILDVDGDRAEIEIFRKRAEEEFFFIDRVTPTGATHDYVDDGILNKRGLDEKTNVWTKSNKTEAIVDNRLVRANVDYFDEIYQAGEGDFTFTLIDSDQGDNENIQLPKNSKAKIFIKPQYDDGTFGYHTEVGEIDINDYGKKLRIEQTGLVSNNDKTIKDIAYYADYNSYGEEFFVRFNSPEVANRHLSTIADQSDFPNRTRVFFGFKYVEVVTNLTGQTDFIRLNNVLVRINGWNTSDNEFGVIGIDQVEITDPFAASSRKITVNVWGIERTYVRQVVHELSDTPGEYTIIYKLEMFEALSDAVKTGQLKVRMSHKAPLSLSGESEDNETAIGISNNVDNEEFLSVEANVVNILDHSLDYREIGDKDGDIYSPRDSRLYVEIDESTFDKIDNININSYALRRDYVDGIGALPEMTVQSGSGQFRVPLKNERVKQVLGFEFVNFDRSQEASLRQMGSSNDGGQRISDEGLSHYFLYHWNHAIYDLINTQDLGNDEELIFLTKRENTTNTGNPEIVELTGFVNNPLDQLNYVTRSDFNIYDIKTEKTELNFENTSYENLIVWSDDIFLGTRYSGIRNFAGENFFPLPTKYGKIIDMYELNGRLYVFCETAVAVCLIGETITRQKGGEVFVTDSNFITAYLWVIDDIHTIKRDSIILTSNQLIFSDGFDVYNISGQEPDNLSNGTIPLDADHEYGATLDNSHKEYRLSDLTDGVTWAYNFESGQWYGPFTFVAKHGAHYRNIVLSGIDGDLVQHNQGNTFAGAAYTTLIQSVANDTEQSFIDKLFRRIYLEVANTNGTTSFKYGKDFNALVATNMSNIPKKSSYNYQGVQPSEKNAKLLYWDIETQDDGFELMDIGVRFQPRDRL